MYIRINIAHGRGGGYSGTEWLPTAIQSFGMDAVKCSGCQLLEGKKGRSMSRT